jgi:hypothetical protein
MMLGMEKATTKEGEPAVELYQTVICDVNVMSMMT